ncbi:uncharacterized protein LOC142352026 isoform X3 [Convolutriloba macropyga]|uniref:uncharacterized protein LOC142352026 isoform X3 n=1 Tax=Convolutriloba macropyga TaxID=536237 RepID=UPI003F525C2C
MNRQIGKASGVTNRSEMASKKQLKIFRDPCFRHFPESSKRNQRSNFQQLNLSKLQKAKRCGIANEEIAKMYQDSASDSSSSDENIPTRSLPSREEKFPAQFSNSAYFPVYNLIQTNEENKFLKSSGLKLDYPVYPEPKLFHLQSKNFSRSCQGVNKLSLLPDQNFSELKKPIFKSDTKKTFPSKSQSAVDGWSDLLRKSFSTYTLDGSASMGLETAVASKTQMSSSVTGAPGTREEESVMMEQLRPQMQRLAMERDSLEKRLCQIQREKSSLQSEFETKLESQAQRYEERITELHAVIFDINKRYDQLHGDTIREEDEEFLDEIDEENEDATSNSNSSASAAAAFNLNLAPTSSSRHQSCNNTTNATPHTSHTQFPTRTSPQAHLTQRNVRNQQEKPDHQSAANSSYKAGFGGVVTTYNTSNSSPLNMNNSSANNGNAVIASETITATGSPILVPQNSSAFTSIPNQKRKPSPLPSVSSPSNNNSSKDNINANINNNNIHKHQVLQNQQPPLHQRLGQRTQSPTTATNTGQQFTTGQINSSSNRPTSITVDSNNRRHQAVEHFQRSMTEKRSAPESSGARDVIVGDEDDGDPYTAEVDALDTCSTSTHCLESPHCCDTFERTLASHGISPCTAAQHNEDSCAASDQHHHILLNLSSSNGAINCAADSGPDCNFNEIALSSRNKRQHHDLEALSTDFDMVMSVDNDVMSNHCRFDFECDSTCINDEERLMPTSTGAVTGSGGGVGDDRRSDKRVSATSADLLTDDDSLILAIERQTAMACRELAKLEFSNLSRPPQSNLNSASRTHSKQNLTSNSITNSATGAWEEKLRLKNDMITNLDCQLNKFRKENDDLKKFVNILGVEKQEMLKRIEEMKKELLSVGGKRNEETETSFNSSTMPNKLQLSKISKANSKPSNNSDSTRSLNLTAQESSSTAERQNSTICGTKINLRPSNSDCQKSSLSSTTIDSSDVGNNEKCKEKNSNANNDSSTGGDTTPLADDRLIELELHLNKSVSKVDRMQSEIDLLQLTLEESKSTSERLALLCGKYESNTTALRIALDYADLCVEALESLLALGASGSTVDYSSLGVSGAGGSRRSPRLPNATSNPLTYSVLGEFSDCEDEYAMLGIKSYVEEEEERLSVKERLQTSRRHAETVAKTILSHLDTTFAKANRVICGENNPNSTTNASTSLLNSPSRPPNTTDNQLQQNQSKLGGGGGGSGSTHSRVSSFNCGGSNVDDSSSQDRTSTTSSTTSGATSVASDWSKLDENRLRDYIRQLKTETAQVRLTVVELESIYMDPEFATTQMKRKRDLEEQQQLMSISNSNGAVINNNNNSSLSLDECQRRERLKQESDMLAAFESQRQDLEYAVLTQELMTLKEEKAELRAQMYLIEKEKKQMNSLKLSQEAQLNAYSVQIDHLKQQLEQQQQQNNKNNTSNSAEHQSQTGSDSGANQKLSSSSSTNSNHGSAGGGAGGKIGGQQSNALSAFTQSPRSAFSTLSSSASASKSEPVSGSEHNCSFSVATPIITLEQLSSVAGGHLGAAATDHHHTTGARAGLHSERTGGVGQSGASSAAVAAVESAAKKREEKLKARIQELVNALETLSKHCETKDRQSSEYMADLKRANSALISAYDKAKKKHSSRLKKLEVQMKAICERHDTTVKVLRQRITLLEESEKTKHGRAPPSETSL